MQALAQKIAQEGIQLNGGMFKVDSFLNHQVDAALMDAAGIELAKQLAHTRPERVLTVEVSGILPALSVARHLQLPLVYARKQKPRTMPAVVYHVSCISPTKGNAVEFFVSPEYLHPGERVLLIDDFLASGRTFLALHQLVQQAGATVVGIGTLIEKSTLGGRAALANLSVPVLSLVTI